MMLIFIFINLFTDGGLDYGFLIAQGFLAIFIIILMLIRILFMKNPIENTIIRLTDKTIIREGQGLSTVELELNNIEFFPLPNGIIVHKYGEFSKFIYYVSETFSKRSNNYGGRDATTKIFIPKEIENFEKIIDYLYQFKNRMN